MHPDALEPRTDRKFRLTFTSGKSHIIWAESEEHALYRASVEQWLQPYGPVNYVEEIGIPSTERNDRCA